MAIRKERDEYVCECDDCGDHYYGGVIDDFMEFVKELKENDWHIKKDGNAWAHLCPCCAEET